MITSVDFNSLTDEDLISEAGALSDLIKSLTSKLDEAKKVVRERNIKSAFGGDYGVSVSEPSTRWTLNQDLIRQEMGESWIIKHSKTSQVAPSVSFKRVNRTIIEIAA